MNLRDRLNLQIARRNIRRRRTRKPLFGVSWDAILDKSVESIVGFGAAQAESIDTAKVAAEVGEWLDAKIERGPFVEVASDFVIDHVIEPLIEDLLDEAIEALRDQADG